MKNKKWGSVFVWLFFATVLVLLPMNTVAKAEDAFVVEEKAVIGGESAEENAGEAVPPSQPQIPVEEPGKQSEEKAEEPKVTKQTAAEEVKEEPPGEQAKEPETVSQNSLETVSRNSFEPSFQIPVRRRDEKQPETDDADEAPPATEIALPQEQAASEADATQKKEPVWMLWGAGVFLLAGIAGILRRLFIRYGKL